MNGMTPPRILDTREAHLSAQTLEVDLLAGIRNLDARVAIGMPRSVKVRRIDRTGHAGNSAAFEGLSGVVAAPECPRPGATS